MIDRNDTHIGQNCLSDGPLFLGAFSQGLRQDDVDKVAGQDKTRCALRGVHGDGNGAVARLQHGRQKPAIVVLENVAGDQRLALGKVAACDGAEEFGLVGLAARQVAGAELAGDDILPNEIGALQQRARGNGVGGDQHLRFGSLLDDDRFYGLGRRLLQRCVSDGEAEHDAERA